MVEKGEGMPLSQKGQSHNRGWRRCELAWRRAATGAAAAVQAMAGGADGLGGGQDRWGACARGRRWELSPTANARTDGRGGTTHLPIQFVAARSEMSSDEGSATRDTTMNRNRAG